LLGFRKSRLRFGSFTVGIFAGVIGLLMSVGCNSSPGAGNRPLTPQEERGQRIFEARCAVCHDAYSSGPRQGPGLQGIFHKKYLPSGAPANDDRARDAIMFGRGNMPPSQNVLDDQQLSDLLAYLHTL
jgi:mono/diheme cytochrome c family protein